MRNKIVASRRGHDPPETWPGAGDGVKITNDTHGHSFLHYLYRDGWKLQERRKGSRSKL